jgi:hypothetical protein
LENKINENTKLCSFDIENMYTNIPTTEVKDIINDLLNKNNTKERVKEESITHPYLRVPPTIAFNPSPPTPCHFFLHSTPKTDACTQQQGTYQYSHTTNDATSLKES